MSLSFTKRMKNVENFHDVSNHRQTAIVKLLQKTRNATYQIEVYFLRSNLDRADRCKRNIGS